MRFFITFDHSTDTPPKYYESSPFAPLAYLHVPSFHLNPQFHYSHLLTTKPLENMNEDASTTPKIHLFLPPLGVRKNL
jgi:hypothetical protein